jgi:apolipoprotein N-acyltransferase
LVKADGSYDSAIVDPYGRILALASNPEGAAATLVADVPLGKANAPAIVLGDWIGWLALAGMAFFTFGSDWLVKKAARSFGN